MIRQSFTLVRSHVGSVGAKRRMCLVGCKVMILFARGLVSAELRPRSNRELQKSEIYFTNCTLTGKPEGYSFWKSDAGRRPEDQSVGNVFVPTVGAIFYFTNRTLTGNMSLFRFSLGSRQPQPTAHCTVVAKLFSPVTL